MTNGIGASSIGYGVAATLISNAAQVHQQLNTLTEQASTGMVADTYAGLGAGASIALDLNPQLTALDTYQKNINQATGSMGVTQVAMTQLQTIAATFVADIPNLNGLNPAEVDNIAANARSALRQVADLLDTKNGDDYVFAGQDSGNPPVPTPDAILSSNFYSQINDAVSTLSSNGSTATAQATRAIAASNAAGTSPFSAYLSQPSSALSVPVVQTGDGTTVPIGLLASSNSGAVSNGASTTGSYMRDLMRSLATLGSLTSAQVTDPEFAGLVQDTHDSLNSVVTAMATDAGILGNAQASLTATQSQMADTATALTGQVSSVQEVDMAATLSNLTATQTQLQESYRMIASANSLSLVNFLPAA